MKIFKRMVRLVPYVRALRALRNDVRPSLFDRDYYRASCPGLLGNVSPLLHFLLVGAFEGRNPHPLFDTAFYLRRYPEVAEAHVNPLAHYLRFGSAEGRQPHPLFDPHFYLARYRDVREAGINPLLHFVRNGAFEGRKPHPLFQPDYYVRGCPTARSMVQSPVVHFLQADPANCSTPHPLFDCQAYLDANPTAAALRINPLMDYLSSEHSRGIVTEGMCQVGWAVGRRQDTSLAPPPAHDLLTVDDNASLSCDATRDQ